MDTIDTSSTLKLLATINEKLRAQPGEPDAAAALAIYWQIEDTDPHVCEREELEELIARARDPFVVGYLSGVWSMRLQVAAMTGRS